MEGPSILFVQAFFMLLPIIVFIILILLKKINRKDIRFVFNINKMNYLYYLPVILVYIPVLIDKMELLFTVTLFPFSYGCNTINAPFNSPDTKSS